MEHINSNRNPRILILGSVNHTKLVTAYDWHKLPSELNVADFDVLIFNFTPFQNSAYAESLRTELLPSWQQVARHLLSSESEIIVIGSPNFTLGNKTKHPSTWWIPFCTFDFVYEKGEDIRNVHSTFEFYFSKVRRYSFYLDKIEATNATLVNEFLKLNNSKATYLRRYHESAAETRFERSIGFALKFELHDGRQYVKESGGIIWLPETTEVSVTEGIDSILRERFEIQFERPEPDWITDFRLPSAQLILSEIAEKERAKQSIENDLVSARLRLYQASRFSKLLYETGEDVLEPVVRDALGRLGASVTDPQVKGREDGRLIDPFGRRLMLEIKGRSGTLRVSDIRELDNWVRDAVAIEGWDSKGLLVANLQLEKSPNERKDFIPRNCSENAARFGISILSTVDLFKALLSLEQGVLDQKNFWDVLSETNGLCEFPVKAAQ